MNPLDCHMCLTGLGDRFSGRVVGNPWPPEGGTICEFRNVFKLQACLEHWKGNVSWEETGIFEHVLNKISENPRHRFDGCSDIGDIRKRYQKLDILFKETKEKGHFPEINPNGHNWTFREKDGIVFHIGPDGGLYFGGNGCHRFALALVLQLTLIPAKLGCVHRNALQFLHLYREKEQKKEQNG